MFEKYDIIVIGGGHAGCEAAMAAANLGSKVLMITMNMQAFAQMSCNPAMGGVAKGQVVREIDAMGGYSGVVSDKSAIQFRMLNRSKGPAMWSPRTQNDRVLFSHEWRKILENQRNIEFWQDMVIDLLISKDTVTGVETKLGGKINAKAVIIAGGTFLNGIIHIGEKNFAGGRIGEYNAQGITECLVRHGFETGRMKTGTPVRIDGRSLDFSKMEEQKGDEYPGKFSFSDETTSLKNQKSCHIVYTNPEVHEILRTGFSKSPLFNSRIQGVGPRYCPSIEDKIERFSARDRHQLFVEPEGWETNEMYLNGFSSSLPEEIQMQALKKIPGFQNVKIFRPGYAIEYDYFNPQQLNHTLETKIIGNLFFAGQINGTTGYEEAAGQGFIAGVNANQKINQKPEFILHRHDAYIGVMIDDLITKGTIEPYRLFTSRAEYRLLLRQDNADLRLTPKAYELGTASSKRFENVKIKDTNLSRIKEFFNNNSPGISEANNAIGDRGGSLLSQKTKYKNLLLRPEIDISILRKEVEQLDRFLCTFDKETIEEAEIQIKYETYIEKEAEMSEKIQRLERIKIPTDFNYQKVKAFSNESREKLDKIKPATIGQASRISGVSPADISILLVHMGR